MWSRRLLYAFVLLCTLMGQLFDIGFLFHFLFIATLCLPVLGLLVSLPAMLGCRATLASQAAPASTPQAAPAPVAAQDAPAPQVRRGAEAGWTLRLEGRSRLPLARAACRLRLLNRTTGKTERFRLPMRRSLPGGKRTWTVDTGHCALVECRVERLRVCDCLGLFTLPVRPPAPGVLLVCPVPEDPGPLPLPEGMGMPLPVPRGKAASGEDYELRPYRDGDSMRAIHWKMSAKRDSLITREPLEDRRPLPVLTFDCFGPPDRVDRVLDRLTGYSRALLDRERPHEIRWADPASGAVRRYAVASARDWTACLTAILSSPIPMQGRSILETPLAAGQDEVLFQIHIEEAHHEEP